MTDILLLHCPFCGAHAQTDFILGVSYLIECYVCKASTGHQDSDEEAIAAWNRRASQCKWPTCQTEEVQAMLAKQIHRDLYGDAPVPQQVLRDGYQSSTMASDAHGATITMHYATSAQADAAHDLLCKLIDAEDCP